MKKAFNSGIEVEWRLTATAEETVGKSTPNLIIIQSTKCWVDLSLFSTCKSIIKLTTTAIKYHLLGEKSCADSLLRSGGPFAQGFGSHSTPTSPMAVRRRSERRVWHERHERQECHHWHHRHHRQRPTFWTVLIEMCHHFNACDHSLRSPVYQL